MKNSYQGTEWHHIVLGLALFLGIILRVFPGIMTGFPPNDGGMFYVMIRDLRLNHYLLPLVTTYNFAEIPFAYPPLGFYLAAILKDVIGLPVLESLRWLPAIINILSIFAFYLLAVKILQDRPRAAIAAAVYALTPGSYTWFIMGGGLTRSLGTLFLLLSLYFLLRTFDERTWKNLLFTSLFCALVVLSHPEAALHTAASCILFWLFFGRTKQGTLSALYIGLGTIIFTFPWWLPLLAGHGTAPVISALHTGMYQLNSFTALLNDIFARDTFIPFLLILRLLGLGWAIWKRQYLLIAWMALPYLVEPRSAPAFTFFSFNIFIAFGAADALPELVNRLNAKRTGGSFHLSFPEIRWLNRFVLLLFIYLFVESALTSFQLINNTLEPSAVEAMTWVNENVPADARFLVLTGKADPMVDPMQEWFPALAERRSQTTLQGYEWTLAEGFIVRWKQLSKLQDCGNTSCVENWSKETGLEFTHLFVARNTFMNNQPASLSNGEYKLVYENSEISVYEK
ncbi:MAG: glycosyltransferase family 39 protein [Chloroflexi bacterium]|nr:glycosyltransferase family 39 protein [Chloroflexota bacterium]